MGRNDALERRKHIRLLPRLMIEVCAQLLWSYNKRHESKSKPPGFVIKPYEKVQAFALAGEENMTAVYTMLLLCETVIQHCDVTLMQFNVRELDEDYIRTDPAAVWTFVSRTTYYNASRFFISGSEVFSTADAEGIGNNQHLKYLEISDCAEIVSVLHLLSERKYSLETLILAVKHLTRINLKNIKIKAFTVNFVATDKLVNAFEIMLKSQMDVITFKFALPGALEIGACQLMMKAVYSRYKKAKITIKPKAEKIHFLVYWYVLEESDPEKHWAKFKFHLHKFVKMFDGLKAVLVELHCDLDLTRNGNISRFKHAIKQFPKVAEYCKPAGASEFFFILYIFTPFDRFADLFSICTNNGYHVRTERERKKPENCVFECKLSYDPVIVSKICFVEDDGEDLVADKAMCTPETVDRKQNAIDVMKQHRAERLAEREADKLEKEKAAAALAMIEMPAASEDEKSKVEGISFTQAAITGTIAKPEDPAAAAAEVKKDEPPPPQKAASPAGQPLGDPASPQKPLEPPKPAPAAAEDEKAKSPTPTPVVPLDTFKMLNQKPKTPPAEEAPAKKSDLKDSKKKKDKKKRRKKSKKKGKDDANPSKDDVSRDDVSKDDVSTEKPSKEAATTQEKFEPYPGYMLKKQTEEMKAKESEKKKLSSKKPVKSLKKGKTPSKEKVQTQEAPPPKDVKSPCKLSMEEADVVNEVPDSNRKPSKVAARVKKSPQKQASKEEVDPEADEDVLPPQKPKEADKRPRTAPSPRVKASPQKQPSKEDTETEDAPPAPPTPPPKAQDPNKKKPAAPAPAPKPSKEDTETEGAPPPTPPPKAQDPNKKKPAAPAPKPSKEETETEDDAPETPAPAPPPPPPPPAQRAASPRPPAPPPVRSKGTPPVAPRPAAAATPPPASPRPPHKPVVVAPRPAAAVPPQPQPQAPRPAVAVAAAPKPVAVAAPAPRPAGPAPPAVRPVQPQPQAAAGPPQPKPAGPAQPPKTSSTPKKKSKKKKKKKKKEKSTRSSEPLNVATNDEDEETEDNETEDNDTTEETNDETEEN